MVRRLVILPTLTKTLATGTSLPAVADVTGQTVTPNNYVGFPAAGCGQMTYLRLGKAQVTQSQEIVLVDLNTRPWPVLQRSVNGSPLVAHDSTHGIVTIVPPDGLSSLVGVSKGAVLVANTTALQFDEAKFDVTDDGSGGVAIALTPSATPIVGNDSIWQAHGDLAAATGPNAGVRVPVGTDGQILVADSGQAAGVGWQDAAAGASFATPTASIDIGDAAAGGSGTSTVREDHQHAYPAPSASYPQAVAAAAVDGTATTPARSDHVHPHGTGYLPDAHHNRSHDHSNASDGTALAPASINVSGKVQYSGEITPAQLTADVNDWNPTSLATAHTIRASSDATRTITGLQGGATGRELWLWNVGSQNIVLADEHTSSSAPNRFALDTSLTLTADTGAHLGYDNTAFRWRLLGIGKATGGGSGNVATDSIFVAKGDLAVGTGTATAARLGAGTNGKPLQADSTQSTGLKYGSITQANSHDSPDTDSATTALHHTLGTGANQAAAGDHAHALTDLTSIDQSAQVLKVPVRVATTTAGTLASSFENGDTVDGVTLATGDRILIKDQASGAENGIYIVQASGAPTRAGDANAAAEFPQGFLVYVKAGTTNANTLWKHTTSAAITLGTTALTFSQLAGSGGGAAALDDLSDVAITSPSNGQVLKYNGSAWVNDTDATGGGGSGNVTSTGAAGSEPGSPASGDLYLPTNGFSVERYSGSAWVPWGPLFAFTAPDDSGFAWVNQSTAATSSSNGTVLLTGPASGTGYSLRIRKQAAQATPYTVTAYLLPNLAGTGVPAAFGLLFRESSSGKLHALMVEMSSGTMYTVYSIKFTDAGTFSATYTSATMTLPFPLWWRLADDGSSRIISYSRDGQDFRTLHSIGRTDFLTADEVGWFVNAYSASEQPKARLLSWKAA